MSVRIVKYGIATMLLGFVALLSSCASSNVREAQKVVAQADSLWHEGKMYGVDMGDSATLAQAYETLKEYSAFSRQFSDSYAHACYHYGKLLRAKENPVEAMQVFIDATHSQTDDYHILGRVYSNMGDICHLAGDYSLSYDMFEKSANLFLQNGDTQPYYFALNDMAFELAEQGEKEGAFSLLNMIPYLDNDISSIIYLTKAVAYRTVEQYDSALHYAALELRNFPNEPTGLLVKAQVYSLIGVKDSAVIYAELASDFSDDLHVINNALYIQTNDDECKEKDEIRQTAADRADVQKLLEIRQGKVAQAAQLLEQDLNRKPDWRWLYTLLAVVLFTATIGVLIYLWHKRSQHRQMIHDIHAKEQEQMHLTNEIDALSNIQEERHHQIRADIEEACRIIRNSEDIKAQLCWNDYNKMCKLINTHFYGLADKLKTHPTMTENDVRMCILVLLDFSYEKIANILNLSPKSIAKLKSLTAHKLGTTMKNLRGKLMQIACQNMELK